MPVTTDLPEGHCPQCGYRLDCCTSTQPEREVPGPGDMSVCLNCGATMIFNDDMTVRGATEIEEAMLWQQPKEASAIKALKQAIKKRGPLPKS